MDGQDPQMAKGCDLDKLGKNSWACEKYPWSSRNLETKSIYHKTFIMGCFITYSDLGA